MKIGPYLFAWLLAIAPALAVDGPKFQVDASWPKPLPNNWTLGQAASFIPPRTKDCVAAPRVIEFDQEGNVLRAWGGPGQGYDWFENEHGINIDAKGFVWLGGNGNNDGQVLKFTQDGKFVLQIGKPGPQTGSADTTRLGRPADAEVDPATNEVYIADGYGNHRVIVFDADTGAYKRHWGAYGKPPSDGKVAYSPAGPPPQQFGNPVHCVKIAKDGLVYVCDRSNDRIQVFRKDGTFVKEFFVAKDTLQQGSIWDLDFWPDANQTFLMNADGANNEVRTLLRETGEIVGAFGRNGRNAGEFHWAHNLAVDSKGNIYTTEVDTGKRAQKFRYVGPPVK